MRILFMGTPDIAAECLKALYAAGHDICAVYTRRDKPVGRKQVLTAPPVKEVALAHGTPVFQPRTLRDGSEDENIRALAPELIVVVAYGCILPKSVLEAPKYGCINLHVSLLPKYRGSAPVQWAVLNGDTETGVSIMQMDEGLDTGDVLVCEKMPVDPEETSGQLFDRVTAVGARVLCEVVPAIAAGTPSGAGSGAAGERGGGHCRRNSHTHPPGARQGHPGPHAGQGHGRVQTVGVCRTHPQLGAGHEPLARCLVYDGRREESQSHGVPCGPLPWRSARHGAGHQASDGCLR